MLIKIFLALSMVLCAVISSWQPAFAQSETIDESRPVTVDGKEVFRVRRPVGPYSVESRVENIQHALTRVKNSLGTAAYIEAINAIRAEDRDSAAEILIGDKPLVYVTDNDAKAEGAVNRYTLAEKRAAALKAALLESVEAHRPANLLVAAGFTALSAAGLIASLFALNWFFPFCYRMIGESKGNSIKSLRIQKAELISADTVADIIIGALRIVRVAAVLVLLALFVPLALSFFPDTRVLAGDIVNHAVQPVTGVAIPAIIAYLPNIFVIAIIAVSTYYMVTFVHFLFNEIARETIDVANFDPEWAIPTYKIVRFLVIAFAFVLIFPYLPGSGSPAFQQISIFLGVLFSLGSSGAISHLVAGIFLTYTGAFKIGDRVKIADAVGDVMEKTLLATRIRTIKHEYVTIPNALVLGSHIINYSSSAKNPGLILHTTVTIGYETPWPEVHKAMLAAAGATDNVLKEPQPFVLQTSLDDFTVSYQLNAYTSAPQSMAVTYSNLHLRLLDEFHKAGIEIMSPRYASLRDGNALAIPPEYLKDGQTAGAFNVKTS
jgi:small-conductance mechanosensitive channel